MSKYLNRLESFWVFFGLTALLATLLSLTSFHFLIFLLVGYWFVRLFCIYDKLIIKWSLLIFLLFYIRGQLIQQENISRLSPDQTEFLVEVKRQSLKVDGDRLRVNVWVQEKTFEEELVLVYHLQSREEREKLLEEGLPATLLIQGTLEEANDQRNFNQFDYRSYLNKQGIFWILEADHLQVGPELQVKKYWPRHWPYYSLKAVDQRIPGKTGQYVKALLFSDRRGLEAQVLESYQNLGLVHLLSISGMHIVMYIKLLRYFFYRTSFTREHVPYYLLILLTIYGFICDWSTSIFRAVIQSHLKSLREIFYLSLTSLDIWSLCLLLALFLNPMSIYSLGFQLSYSLSLLLILLPTTPKYTESSPFKQSLLQSLAINLLSLPFILYHHFEFPVLSFAMNLVVLPLFSSLIIPLVLFMFILGCFFSKFSLYQQFLLGSDFFFESFEQVLLIFKDLPNQNLVTGRLSFFAYLVLAFIIIYMLLMLDRPGRFSVKNIIFPILILILTLTSEKWLPQTRVVMLDVGQGDCILIKRPFWQDSYLIDTGGQLNFEKEDWQEKDNPYQMGRDMIVPVLKSFGLSSLDALVISHADHDHVGELNSILDHFSVKKIVMSAYSLEEESMQNKLKRIAKHGTELEVLEGDALPQALDQDFLCLWPASGERLDMNNSSIVLYGKIKDDYWLFTGDIEKEVEDKLIKHYPRLSVDVLKVGHHGSNSSSQKSFIRHIKPSYALISAGRNNRYGHPHPEIVALFEKEEVKIYRTDQDASVQWIYQAWKKKPIIIKVQDNEEVE